MMNMRIGPYEIYLLETCRFRIDGGAMFGAVPKTIWSKHNPPDKQNRIELAARALVIQGNNKLMLVDCGLGTKLHEKEIAIYCLDTSQHELHRSLKTAGITAREVTHVLLTHLHFDHVGGATFLDRGELKPTFPNAKYFVQKAHWQWALNPTDKDRGGFIPDDFLQLDEQKRLEFIDGEAELLQYISLVVSNGHTRAKQLPKIHFEGRTVFFCCDLIPTVAHLRPSYISAHDLWPLTTLEEKKKILATACDENWILLFQHDANSLGGTISACDKGFLLKDPVQDALLCRWRNSNGQKL